MGGYSGSSRNGEVIAPLPDSLFSGDHEVNLFASPHMPHHECHLPAGSKALRSRFQGKLWSHRVKQSKADLHPPHPLGSGSGMQHLERMQPREKKRARMCYRARRLKAFSTSVFQPITVWRTPVHIKMMQVKLGRSEWPLKGTNASDQVWHHSNSVRYYPQS